MTNNIKHIKTLLSAVGLFLILLCSSATYSQSAVADQLIGTWGFDQAASLASITAETQAKMDTIPAFKTQLLAAYSGRSTYFGSDGMYKVSLSDGRSATGTWQLTGPTELKLTDARGNASYKRIATVQENRLVLIPVPTDGFESIIKQWHFVKL